jgi:hypothetical protein
MAQAAKERLSDDEDEFIVPKSVKRKMSEGV